MKTAKKSLSSYLFYPHLHLDGWKAIAVGLGIQLLAAILAHFLSGRYDGLLDYHLVEEANLHNTVLDLTINLFSLLLVFGGCIGLIGRGRNRLIDVVGLVLLARAPVVVLPLLNIGDYFRQMTPRLLTEPGALNELPTPTETILLLLFALIALAILAWWLILLYRVYSLLIYKSTYAYTLLFVLLVVLGEYISKSLILIFNT